MATQRMEATVGKDADEGGGRSPTLETLVVIVVVFVLQQVALLVSRGLAAGLFVLAPPVTARPWTLLASVYAHAGVAHLVSNAVVLAVVGFAVESVTTRWRFHAFFAVVGMLSGVTQVLVSGLVGPATAVLGASGAVFGLVGYLLAGNPVTDAVLGWLPLGGRAKVALLLAFAVAATMATAAPGVALVAHFTGFVLGAIAGRLKLLDV